jgi:hypothetical protein
VNVAFPKGVGVLSVLVDGEMAAIDTYPIDGNRTVVRSTIEILTGLQSEMVFTLNSSFQCQTHTIRVAPLRHDVVVR